MYKSVMDIAKLSSRKVKVIKLYSTGQAILGNSITSFFSLYLLIRLSFTLMRTRSLICLLNSQLVLLSL